MMTTTIPEVVSFNPATQPTNEQRIRKASKRAKSQDRQMDLQSRAGFNQRRSPQGVTKDCEAQPKTCRTAGKAPY